MEHSGRVLLGAALSTLMLAGCASSGGTKAEAPPSGDVAKGACHDINACKGTGDCGGKGTSCAGTNECKGQGWKTMDQADCEAAGGTFKK